MTAIEDFMAEHDGLRLAVIPIFFGCGLLWPEGAPWADEVAEITEPWDRNPILERVENARVTQLVQRHSREQEIDERFDLLGRKLEEAIRRILASRAFGALESLSRLRRGGKPAFSRQELSELLAEGEQIRRDASALTGRQRAPRVAVS